MDWSSFIGSVVGTFLTIIAVICTILIWDYFDRKKSSEVKSSKPDLDDLLENHLEKFIVRKFDVLFPHWKIYEKSTINNAVTSGSKPLGVRYRTDAGEIDILCVDEKENFVVIELKRKRASDKVISQVNRYMAWVQKNMANPNQKVRGIIIAKSYSNRLLYSLSRYNDIDAWQYDWNLIFNTNVSLESEFVEVKT